MSNMMTKGTQAGKPATLIDIVGSEQMKNQWAVVLPTCMTPERLARVAVTQLRKTPKLAQCNQGSFLGALMTCAELGIEPNGRHAHLIPYGQECQLIIDYKGLVELAMRSGKVSRIHADVVCENDRITIRNGEIDHEINPLHPRGEVVGAYAMCFFRDGTAKHEYMSKEEIDAIRSRSKAGKSGPWVTDYNEMAKKTVFRRMSKWLPLSPEVMDSVEREADQLRERPATGVASAPVYTPEMPAVMSEPDPVDNPELKPAPERDADLDGNARPSREPADPANMKKAELLAEVESYRNDPRFDDIVTAVLPEGTSYTAAPSGMLREMVDALRSKGGEK